MDQVSKIIPSPPLVVSQQQVVHVVSLKDRKQYAPQNHATVNMEMFITPKSSSIKYMQQTTYHYAHAN